MESTGGANLADPLTTTRGAPRHDYDVLVVGSGFGGSVAALRLTEKGYRVGVLEAGRRFEDHEFATTSWRVKDFLWAPAFGLLGIQRIHVLPDVLVLAGAGVGGGSLVYANTLYVPPQEFFDDSQWAAITDWASELAPHYDQASRMLGVTTVPRRSPLDEIFEAVAQRMGAGATFRPTPVGVYFGQAGRTDPDPYFGGAGPARTGCIECGKCMTGCRYGAKNTLPKNYLGLAEGAGARVVPRATVTEVRPLPAGGYALRVRRTGPGQQPHVTLTAEQVVLAAGAYGTQRLLHRMRDDGLLTRLSPTLGLLTRSNSESLVGAVARRRGFDLTRGVAITSSFHPDPHTHIEPVRYGRGSNLMGLLGTVLTDPEADRSRLGVWARALLRDPARALRSLSVRHWSERAAIALVMQSLDNSLTVSSRRGAFGRWTLTSRQGEGEPNPSWIPAANQAARLVAEQLDGDAMGNLGEVFDAPMTAHFVGGAVIGADADQGVVDAYHRVYGHPGLHVLDGAAICANLGVNPALTITALAERAVSMWPNRGRPDPRPALGESFRRLAGVLPDNPVVPADAHAALRTLPMG